MRSHDRRRSDRRDPEEPGRRARRGAGEPTADNGPELTVRVLAEWGQSGLTETAYIDPGAPWQNAWVESFDARLHDELLDVEEFSTPVEAQVLAADYRDDETTTTPTVALGALQDGEAGTHRSVNPELSEEMDR